MKFLERLQNADEDRKERWLIISSIIAGVIVIILWVKYFVTIANIGSAGEPAVAAEGTRGFGFSETMRSGMRIIAEGVWQKIRSFSEALQTPREYIVKPPQ